MPTPTSQTSAARAISEVPFWYHTIEVAPGIETAGQFDLRPVIDRLPWPDVAGKRCLDIGTWDGFLAFELERRGAREVVAIDIPDHEQWDWPPRVRSRGIDYMRTVAGPRRGDGFRVARELLGSSVDYDEVNVYDLSPEGLGRFDVVTCGSLLLHLRDPFRALEAIRSVCRELFLSANQVDLWRSILSRRRPLLRLDGLRPHSHWFLPNAAAHRRMIEAGGFDIERESGLYSIPFGAGHPRPDHPRLALGTRARAGAARLARRTLTGNHGVPHHAVLARPIES